MELTYAKDNQRRRPMEHYTARYRDMDPLRAAERCCIPFDPDKSEFTLRLMGREFRVSHPEFRTVPEATAVEAILLIRYLLEAVQLPLSGKFVTYRDVPWGETYFRNFEGRCLKRLAFTCGGRLPLFRKAMERLGGTPVATGDAGYRFPFMDGLEMQFIVWEGDEEFPPSAQILFSDNFNLAFTAEDMAAIGDVSIGRVKAAMEECREDNG